MPFDNRSAANTEDRPLASRAVDRRPGKTACRSVPCRCLVRPAGTRRARDAALPRAGCSPRSGGLARSDGGVSKTAGEVAEGGRRGTRPHEVADDGPLFLDELTDADVRQVEKLQQRVL